MLLKTKLLWGLLGTAPDKDLNYANSPASELKAPDLCSISRTKNKFIYPTKPVSGFTLKIGWLTKMAQNWPPFWGEADVHGLKGAAQYNGQGLGKPGLAL